MSFTRKVRWALDHPQSALKGIAGRLWYPKYKSHVGPPEMYEILGRYQFELLLSWGLQPHHSLLDLGCGSLRAGRSFIQYLGPENYFGIEPSRKVLEDGIKHNLNRRVFEEKKPTFSNDGEFNLSVFNKRFDFILAHSILTHAAQHQIKKCFTEARKVMTATSVFFANYNKGETDYTGKKWVYPLEDCDEGFHGAVTYTFSRLCSLAREAGLDCAEIDVEHPTGSTWLLVGEPNHIMRLSGRVSPNRCSQPGFDLATR